jgi:hypothetical protein
MEAKDIATGDRIIAEFVSLRVDSLNGDTWIVGHNGNEVWHNESSENWAFHTSFDWLMPVVGKIKKSGDYYYSKHFLSRHGAEASEILDRIDLALTSVDIEAVWQAVVAFLEYYNQQSKP